MFFKMADLDRFLGHVLKDGRTRKHLFENWVAPISHWIWESDQSSFVNLIHWNDYIFIKIVAQIVVYSYTNYHMTSEDCSLLRRRQYFHFHYIDKNNQVIQALCTVHLNRFGTSRVRVIDQTCYVRLEYMVRWNGLFMNLLIFHFLVPGTAD